MKYKGLIEDEELFQCTFFLILAISALIGAMVSLVFLILNFPYSDWVLIVLIIIGISSSLKFRELEEGIKEKQKEFEAHERKEEMEK